MNIKYSIKKEGKQWLYSLEFVYLPEERTLDAVMDRFSAFARKVFDKLENVGFQWDEIVHFILMEENGYRTSEVKVRKMDIERIKEILNALMAAYEKTLPEVLESRPYLKEITRELKPDTIEEIKKFYVEHGLGKPVQTFLKGTIKKDWGIKSYMVTIDVDEKLIKNMKLSFIDCFLLKEFPDTNEKWWIKFDAPTTTFTIPYGNYTEQEIEQFLTEKDLNLVAEKMESAIHNTVCYKPIRAQNTLNLDQNQTNCLNKIGIVNPLCTISYELKKETPGQKLQMVDASVQLSAEEYDILKYHYLNGFRGKRIYTSTISFDSPLKKLRDNEIISDEKELSTPETLEQLFKEIADDVKTLQNRIVNSIIQNARLLKPKKVKDQDIFGNIEMSSETKKELAPVLLEVRLTQENN